ncbi:MAG: hypothetical protein IJK36_02430 [Bacteroidales bacterium]|nr:hypothetical protein [Bacteroidales bacterium]
MQHDNNPQTDMKGRSFLDGKERLDVREIQNDQYLVTRTKEHPFLKDKKSIRDETWEVEKFNSMVANGTFKEIPTYTYTTTQKPYEVNEINLRNKGLVSMERTENGMVLTFDHPASRKEMGLTNLSPTPETKALLDALTNRQTSNQTVSQQASPTPAQNPTQTNQKADDSVAVAQQQQQTADNKTQMSPILKQFYDLKSKHPDAMLLFHVGDFYETYQQDAQKATETLGVTLMHNNKIKDKDGKPIEMAGFPHHALDTYLPKLIRAGIRVAICDQLVMPILKKDETIEQKPSQQTDTPHTRADLQSDRNRNGDMLSPFSASHSYDMTPPNTKKTEVPSVAVPQQQPQNVGQTALIAEISKLVGENKGVAISPDTPLSAKNTKGIEFEVDRIIREYSGDLRIYGWDSNGKERSVPIERTNKDVLTQILSELSSGKNIMLNAQDNTTAQNQGALDRHNTPQTLSLSPKQNDLIDTITDFIGDKRGVGVSPKMPIMTRNPAGDEFPVDMIAKDRQGNIRLMGTDFLGQDCSVTLQKADVKTLEDIVRHLNSSNLLNAEQNRRNTEKERRSTMTAAELNADKTEDEIKTQQISDALSAQNKLVNMMTNNNVEFLKVNIPARLFNAEKGVERNTIITSVQLREDDFGNHSLALIDKKNNSYDLSAVEPQKQMAVILKATDTFNKLYAQQANQTHVENSKLDVSASHHPNIPSKTNDFSVGHDSGVTKPNGQTADQSQVKRQNRKLLAAEKVHTAAKAHNPDNLVFVRLRDPESKKLMYQTFGDDTEKLQKLSPSITIDRQEIKHKQHPVVTLQQEAIAAVRADLMTHNALPVIINAKGEKIENDHLLAFSQNDLQNFLQQQAGQKTVESVAISQQQPQTNTAQNTDPKASQQATPTPAQEQSPLSSDATLQYMVKRNSHYPGVFDIRLYVNGEKAGAHRLSEEDRDLWRSQKVPIEDLMVKYFGKELGMTKFPNLTYFRGDEDAQQATTIQQNQPDTNPEKVKNYDARAQYHSEVSQEKNPNNDSLVMLKMMTRDANTFFQTFNRDADTAAEILGRKTIAIGENRYISLTEKDMTKLTDQFGVKTVIADYNPHTAMRQQQPTQQQGTQKADLPEIKPNTRVEYVISPVMTTNKQTGQQERVPGVFALSVTAENTTLGRKTLTKDERDLLDRRPSEITNVINKKFANELQGVTLSFKQVHRPAVSEEQWNNREMPGGLTLDYSKVTNNSSEGRYEMTAKINGTTLGPKPMYKQEVNDFFDKARPLTDIVAKVFREEIKSLNMDAAKQDTPKMGGNQAMSLWNKAHEDGNDTKIAFVQREGRFGVFYQTFGEDAKNMSKITNRSIKVTDTESQKNVIYSIIPDDQIQAVFRQLRSKGFQPFAVNTRGEPVSVMLEQKISTPKSVSLDDGRKIEDIQLRNANGKWLMTANLDGKPMPQREISMEDARTFKQGQQTMSDILTKYFSNDLTTQDTSQKKGMGR